MRYVVDFTASAVRELGGLPRTVQERIGIKISALADNPYPPGAKKLSGQANLFRIRVGDYRIVYRVLGDKLIVTIIAVGHRREIYR